MACATEQLWPVFYTAITCLSFFFFFFFGKRTAHEIRSFEEVRRSCCYDANFFLFFHSLLYRYTGPGATANAGYQQEDDRGSESLVRFVGEGTGASGHPQR